MRSARFLLVGVVSVVSCSPATNLPVVSAVPLDTAQVVLTSSSGPVEVLVEVAEEDSQKQFGLMRRPALDSLSGMIFLYPEVQDTLSGFWMFNTEIPLDIAFVDSAGVIASIRAMQPCESPNPQWCPITLPGARYQSALELNLGMFDRLGVTVGDTLRLVRQDDPPS